jgi:pimeloyl-ACP methyl ester carboxylesterase
VAEPAVPASSDSLAVWRERAARAQAWLKARASDAEQAAADAMARARGELLGSETPVAQATLALATRPGDLAEGEIGPTKWVTMDDTFVVLEPAELTEIVLLIHGLDEPGTIWDELTPHLLDHGANVVRFDYPNDQGLVESGRDLLTALRRLRTLGVERVSIVAHSMGGLVSREVLTSPDGYAGNAAATKELPAIERLIMCGTPNHGSPLASMQAIAEAREQVVRRVQGTAATGSGLMGHSGDGNGEAGRDLCENSEFLKALNSRPQPLGVAMTTLCGIMTPAAAFEYLKDEASEQWAGFLGADRAKALMLQARAVVETLGDGMVPAASTRLEGVADHVELKADHRSMLKRWTILNKLDELRGRKTPPAEAIPIILDRLGLEPLPTTEPVDPTPRAE